MRVSQHARVLLWSMVVLLLVASVGEGVWLYRQHEQLQTFQTTEVRILSGNMEETIHSIDVFANGKDRADLKELYVRLWWLQNEADRLQEVLHVQSSTNIGNRTTPSGLVDLIQRNNIDSDKTVVYLRLVQAKLQEYQQGSTASIDDTQKLLRFLTLWDDVRGLANQKHAEWRLP